jgi:hypothetical protein
VRQSKRPPLLPSASVRSMRLGPLRSCSGSLLRDLECLGSYPRIAKDVRLAPYWPRGLNSHPVVPSPGPNSTVQMVTRTALAPPPRMGKGGQLLVTHHTTSTDCCTAFSFLWHKRSHEARRTYTNAKRSRMLRWLRTSYLRPGEDSGSLRPDEELKVALRELALH